MDSFSRQFHAQAAAGLALRGALVGGCLGLFLGLGELIATATLGETLLLASPGSYPLPYALFGALAGFALGVLSTLIDTGLRRLGRRRPRAGVLLPILTSVLATGYAMTALTVAGVQWTGMANVLEASAFVLVLMGLGAFLATRDEPKPGWSSVPRGIELAALVAFSLCLTSLLLIRTGWLRSIVHPGRVSYALVVAVFPVGVAVGRLIDAALLRVLRPLGPAGAWFRPAAIVVAMLVVGSLLSRRHGEPVHDTVPPPNAPNVVLIVLDGARHDSVSALAKTLNPTPGFDKVAAAGTLFDAARTPSPSCLASHLALMTGSLSSAHGVTGEAVGEFREERRSPSSPRTLAERLARAGYRTVGFSNNPWVGSITGLDAGFHDFLEVSVARHASTRVRQLASRALVDPWSADDGATETARAAAQWLKDRGDRPFFMFVNLSEPMPPWTPQVEPHLNDALKAMGIKALRDVSGIRAVCELPIRYWLRLQELDWRDWDVVRAAHQAEVALADEAVASIWDAVQRVGLDSRTLFIVTSDHGQGMDFATRALDNHMALTEGVLRVPLAIAGPGIQAGQMVTVPVSTLDLLPTVLERVGLEADKALEGVSLGPLLAGQVPDALASRAMVSEYPSPRLHLAWALMHKPGADLTHLDANMYVLVKGDKKHQRDDTGRQAYYDLEFDPDEENPDREPRTDWAKEMKSELDTWLARHPARKESTTDAARETGAKVQSQMPFEWR